MKIVERIIRGLFLFLFGLAAGGIGMWFTTMNVIKEVSREDRTKRKVSYYDYWTRERIT